MAASHKMWYPSRDTSTAGTPNNNFEKQGNEIKIKLLLQ